jgi:hypothetical protein
VANNADGRLQVFVRGGDSVIYYRAQRAPNGVWDDWSALGGGAVKSFSVGANQDGRLEVVAVWVDGASYHIWQTSPNGNWSGWETLGGWQLQGPVALGRNADGRLEAFVVGGDGVVYHQRQTQVGQDPWNGWATLGDPSVPAVVDVAVAAGVHGRLFLFLMRLDQALSYRAQIGPNGDWGAPVHLHGHDRLWPLVVGHNPDGRLDVFVVGRDGQIHNRKQSHRATPDLWSDWAMLGGSQLQVGIGIGSNSSQELELYVIGGDQRLYRGHRAVDEETLAVRVQITNMLDHIPATNQQMSLMSIYPKVTVAQNGLQLTDAANGIFDGVTVLQDTIPIHMEIWRTFKKVFGKPIQDDKKGWMVDWGPAIGIQPMPSKWQVDANGDPYPAEVLAKLHPTYPAPDGFDSSTAARSLVLAYSHDLGVISGDVSGKPATKIHVPGVGSSSIEFDLAISER